MPKVTQPNSTHAPGLNRRNFLRTAAPAAAVAVAIPSATAQAAPDSSDFLEIRRLGKTVRDACALNGNVIESVTPELWDANEEVLARAQAEFDALKHQIWAKPVLSDMDVKERAEIARWLSCNPYAENGGLRAEDVDGLFSYLEATTHLLVAVLALSGLTEFRSEAV